MVLRSPLEGVSCGVASTDDDVGPMVTPARLFRLADAAQYRAKRSRSARPVVAGRTLPPEAAVRMTDRPLRPGDRRLIRGRDRVDAARVLGAGLEVLDELRAASAQERLAALADVLAHRVDALGWWLSEAPPAAGLVRTVRFALIRSHPGVETQPGTVGGLGAEFALADYPLTAAVLRGGAELVLADDPAADPGEVAILDGIGAVGVCVAGACATDGTGWLLELFLDELSASAAELVGVVRALVLAAVADGGSGA